MSCQWRVLTISSCSVSMIPTSTFSLALCLCLIMISSSSVTRVYTQFPGDMIPDELEVHFIRHRQIHSHIPSQVVPVYQTAFCCDHFCSNALCLYRASSKFRSSFIVTNLPLIQLINFRFGTSLEWPLIPWLFSESLAFQVIKEALVAVMANVVEKVKVNPNVDVTVSTPPCVKSFGEHGYLLANGARRTACPSVTSSFMSFTLQLPPGATRRRHAPH